MRHEWRAGSLDGYLAQDVKERSPAVSSDIVVGSGEGRRYVTARRLDRMTRHFPLEVRRIPLPPSRWTPAQQCCLDLSPPRF